MLKRSTHQVVSFMCSCCSGKSVAVSLALELGAEGRRLSGTKGWALSRHQ